MDTVKLRKRMPATALFDPVIVFPAIGQAFVKLDPRTLVKNPVMFVLEVVTLLTTALLIRDILTDLIDKLLWIRRRGTAAPNRIQSALQEIKVIFAALEKRDSAKAEKAMRKHVQASLDARNLYHAAAANTRPRSPLARRKARAMVMIAGKSG